VIPAEGTSTVVLGGGFGGLTAANELRQRLGKEHQVVVIDREPQFSMGLAKLWVLSGRREYGEGARDRSLLEAKGIKFVEAEAIRIDAAGRRVVTTVGDFGFDYLIIALGADLLPESVNGFTAGAINFYTFEGAAELRDRLRELETGRLVVMVSSAPFKCPSAPYEAAMLMDAVARERGVRGGVDIQIFTPEPQPLPMAGPLVGSQVRALLIERGIRFNPDSKPKLIDARRRRVYFENGAEAEYDLLAGVPGHAVPKVIRDSGLAGPSGWIPVEGKSLRTGVPNVFAVGDVAGVKMANGLLMPKLGMLAEQEGAVVAKNIANELVGIGARSEFDGHGTCFVEVGGGRACPARGEFLAEPSPRVLFEPPTAEAFTQKKEFEASRLAAWF